MTRSKAETKSGGKGKPTIDSIYDGFGGFENFLLSYGLKPYNQDDIEEGTRIAETMLEHDLQDWEESMKLDQGRGRNENLPKEEVQKKTRTSKPTLDSIYDGFGGFENFLLCYGLKPYDQDDVEEGARIAETMLEHDLQDWEEGMKLDQGRGRDEDLPKEVVQEKTRTSKPTLDSIYDGFGGFENFLLCYGLKPYNQDDVEEGARIAETMLEHDLQDWEESTKLDQGGRSGEAALYAQRAA